jgi:hypothetical protein
MEVNFTLIIQGVQFFCTYGFLYKYFFTPVYQVIVAQEKQTLLLLQDLEEQKKIEQNILLQFSEQKFQNQKVLLQSLEQLESSLEVHVVDPVVIDEKTLVFQVQDIEHIESFLVNHLSEVVKK